MAFNSLCKIWGSEVHSSTYKSTDIDFRGFKRDNYDVKPCEP